MLLRDFLQVLSTRGLKRVIEMRSLEIVGLDMDLLVDIGSADQLTAARAENAVLQKLVKKLNDEITNLKLQNAALEAEAELYRSEMDGKFVRETQEIHSSAETSAKSVDDVAFFRSGDGVFCKYQGIVIKDSHGLTNPLCLALSPDETLICSGGANDSLLLYQWGAIANDGVIPKGNRVELLFAAPVVGVAATQSLVAIGCMDGSVHVVQYMTGGVGLRKVAQATAPLKHLKFCKNILWCDDELLVSAAADGNVHLYRVTTSGPLVEEPAIHLTHWKSLHFGAAVECACTYGRILILYVRGTNFLTLIDLDKELSRSVLSLNQEVLGGFSDHVSFTVLDLAVYENYLACATDANRQIIIDLETEVIIRNLYGHDADSYSTPKVAWSSNGEYLYCNTQNSSAMVVYEIASGKIVEEIKEPHTRPIKDMCSASSSNMLVTTAFDRQTCIWFSEK